MHIDVEHSPKWDFARYRTYSWRPRSVTRPRTDPRGPSDALDWRIRNAVETELAAKGLVLSLDAPDFFIDYRVTHAEKSTDTIQDFIKYRESGGQSTVQEAYVFGYQEAKLILEVFDATSEKLVWRAAAVMADANQDKQQRLVAEAVHRMLEKFPPLPGAPE